MDIEDYPNFVYGEYACEIFKITAEKLNEIKEKLPSSAIETGPGAKDKYRTRSLALYLGLLDKQEQSYLTKEQNDQIENDATTHEEVERHKALNEENLTTRLGTLEGNPIPLPGHFEGGKK